MIVLEKLDLGAHAAEFRSLVGTRCQARDALGRLRPLLERLGIDHVGLVLVGGRRIETVWRTTLRPPGPHPIVSQEAPSTSALPESASPTAAGASCADPSSTRSTLVAPTTGRSFQIVHTLELEDGVPTYIARFAHRREDLDSIGAYTNLILATHGPLRGSLNFLQLALYELCANALDHGRPLASDTEIELGLRLEEQVVSGWLRDGCESFDPRSVDLPPLAVHAANRPRRGYGLHMVFQILDSLSHDFDGTGNRLTFRKEIAS